MIEKLTYIGFLWYYFNILCVAGIVFSLLAIMYQRAGRTIINTSERPYKPDNTPFKFTVGVAIFGIIFFGIREYGTGMIEFSKMTFAFVEGYFG